MARRDGASLRCDIFYPHPSLTSRACPSTFFPQLIDYVRVYQIEGEENWGCDPDDYPTADYIDSCVLRLSSASSLLSTDCRLPAHPSATLRLTRTPTTQFGATQASTGQETACSTVAKGDLHAPDLLPRRPTTSPPPPHGPLDPLHLHPAHLFCYGHLSLSFAVLSNSSLALLDPSRVAATFKRSRIQPWILVRTFLSSNIPFSFVLSPPGPLLSFRSHTSLS